MIAKKSGIESFNGLQVCMRFKTTTVPHHSSVCFACLSIRYMFVCYLEKRNMNFDLRCSCRGSRVHQSLLDMKNINFKTVNSKL